MFGEFFGTGHWTAAALGVGGCTVEELTYRIIAGGEKFKQDPLVGLELVLGARAGGRGRRANGEGPGRALRCECCMLSGAQMARWRLASTATHAGPAALPQVIVIQIGLMNRLTDNVGGKLGWLLGWLERALPTTHVVVLAPYPSVKRTSAALWQQMKPQVRAHWPHAMPSACGSNMDPMDRTLYVEDGIHLTPEGEAPGMRSSTPGPA